MSRSFSLVCHHRKQSLDIGQGRRVHGIIDMQVLYSGMPDVMEALRLFLNDTAGHPLVLMDSESIDDDYEQLNT